MLGKDTIKLVNGYQVQGSIWVLHGPRNEAEGVLLTPSFALFGQTGLSYAAHFLKKIVDQT